MALARVREARKPRAGDVGQAAVHGVGHDGRPPTRLRRDAIEYCSVHVAVRRVRGQPPLVDVHPESVVSQPHVVPELVREGEAAALHLGEAEDAGNSGDNAADVGGADDQVHEVGAGLVAQGVRLVEIAVRRVCETADVARAGGLGIPHLRPAHQRQTLLHAARRVGLVGLGDPEVDLGLDAGRAARRLARGRRIEDGDVYRDVRPRPARGPPELDGGQPFPPSGRRAGPGNEDVQLLESRLFQAGRKRSRQAPVV